MTAPHADQVVGDFTTSLLALEQVLDRPLNSWDFGRDFGERFWRFMRRGLEARGLSADALRQVVFTSRWSTAGDEWVLGMEWPAGPLGGVMRATAREPRAAYMRTGWWGWPTYRAGAKLLRSLG